MIPFISQLPAHEQNQWVVRLNRLLENDTVVLASEVPSKQARSCRVAIVANPDVSLLAHFPELVWVHSLWAGVEKLMMELTNSDIKVVRLIDPKLSQAMAEAVLAWSLYLHRDMPVYAKQQRKKQWQQHPYIAAEQRNIGILGLGELGQASALSLVAQGFNVLGWSRTLKSLDSITCYSGENGLKAMVALCDIVVCLLPLTSQTHGLVNQKRIFSVMPDGASLINFSRGGIVNTLDLLNALKNGRLKHAVLDVFDQEPLIDNSPLWQHPDITILPHISAPTRQNSACEIVVNNIKRYQETGIVPKSVNTQRGY